MRNDRDGMVPLIVAELPDQDKKEFSGTDLKGYLAKQYGAPHVISTTPEATESVFAIGGQKIGLIEDAKGNLTGYSIYRGAIPDAFVQKQQGVCTNGYTLTKSITTTSPTIRVSVLTWLFGGGPMVVALALANLIAHATNVSAAKTADCAPCTPPCTCTATTVAGAGPVGVTITPIRVWGIPVSATAVHVIATRITVICV